VRRAQQLREYRKTQRRHQRKIAQLQAHISALEQTAPVKEGALAPAAAVSDLTDAQQVRTLCVLLVLHSVVSFRSVPRILGLLQTQARAGISWVPHFTSVINWSLRVGLGLLRQVAPIDEPWMAIIDHSIDVGTKKALVVLRVPLAALALRGAAIRLEDCQCIGLTIAETVNGETLAQQLTGIFSRAGLPAAITKDCDATLNKGVRLWMEQVQTTLPVIEDIGHVMASALKAQFEQTDHYKRFTTFATTAVTVSQLLETLKHNGLDPSTDAQCRQLAEYLPANSLVRHRLRTWLDHHSAIQHQLTCLPLIVSSDIIESLFGNFKYLLERSPQADMNRTVLLIPALCGYLDPAILAKALALASHGDLVAWEKKNIPYTLRKKRTAFFADDQSQKPGNSSPG
jgi:hypothetical protein